MRNQKSGIWFEMPPVGMALEPSSNMVDKSLKQKSACRGVALAKTGEPWRLGSLVPWRHKSEMLNCGNVKLLNWGKWSFIIFFSLISFLGGWIGKLSSNIPLTLENYLA